MSPQKKKIKLKRSPKPLSIKREHESDDTSTKRQKSDTTLKDEDRKSMKRKNFVKACEQVSLKAYLNYAKRFNLLYLPQCTSNLSCIHQDVKCTSKLNQIPKRIEEAFKIEIKTSTWYEALEVCLICINPSQYLSDIVLQDIVEIMLNAHEDTTVNCNISNLLEQCQQVLSLNFKLHPPCIMKSIRKCYINFLTSPMDLKQNTFTNRSYFGCDKGVVKYCFNRLEYELSLESKDEALIDKFENTPEEMKQSIQGLYWQKEKFEIYELLNRVERIDRLMAVLNSIVELLQFDLAIWHSRYTKNLGSHVMRSHKPLMAFILWSNNILYTGAVNINCRQILKLFVYFIHLQYPEQHVKTMSNWINTMIQTFYICETNSNSDFPNNGKYCTAFANEFFKIITEMPPSTIIRILERIQPTFMRYLISKQYLDNILPESEDEIINSMIHFIQNKQWEKFAESNEIATVPKALKVQHIKPDKLLSHLSKILKKELTLNYMESVNDETYPKFRAPEVTEIVLDQSSVVLLMYITFNAYLDAFSVNEVQQTLDTLNEQLDQEVTDSNMNMTTQYSSYSVTENFIKKYRSIYQRLKALILLLHKMKADQTFPEVLNIFETIPLLGL